MSLKEQIVKLSQQVKEASANLATLSTPVKDAILKSVAEALRTEGVRKELLDANGKDLKAAEAKGISGALLDRLKLDANRIESMIQGLEEVAALPDPVGIVKRMWTRPNGLKVGKKTIPLGVIAIIYEARPNVTIDAFALCFKAGNATVLKGGSESIHSNRALLKVIGKCLAKEGLEDACRLVDSTDRQAVTLLLEQEETIDLVIPRGGESLIRFVVANSRIPVIKHYKGVCHVYIEEDADMEMALSIAENAKVNRPGVCNAMETLLVHEGFADRFLPTFWSRMKQAGVELRGCEKTRKHIPDALEASEEDYYEEFLDLTLAVKVVDDMDSAVAHIRKYGSDHTETIVTESYSKANRFIDCVNSSVVMVNASTRFSDGNQLGLGAEIGISTTKLHAYGPMGLEGLVAEKFIVYGNGQIRA